jgi:hypothetical protein
MHRTPSRRRSAARLLSLAAAAGLGAYYNTAPDPANPPAGGGGGAAPPPAKTPENDPDKLTLTKAELQAQIDAAVKAQQDKADAAAKKKQDDADRKKAEEQGEFKNLLDQETEKNTALAAENRTLKTRIALGDHLAAKHPDYAARAKYILPLIPADTKDEDLAKAVEAAAAEFVKDNPVQAKGSAAAPPAPRGAGTKPGGTNKPAGHVNRFAQSTAADSF